MKKNILSNIYGKEYINKQTYFLHFGVQYQALRHYAPLEGIDQRRINKPQEQETCHYLVPAIICEYKI